VSTSTIDAPRTVAVRAEPERRGLGPLALTAPAAAGMLLFAAAPIVTFVIYSVISGALYTFAASTPFTLENYTDVLSSSANRSLAANSAIVGGLAGGICVTLGIPVAYWLRYQAGRWELPVLFLVVTAMFASYLVRIFAWRTMLGDNGIVNRALLDIGVIGEPLSFLLYSRFALVVAIVHIMLPWVILIMYAGFRPLEPRYLEAARDLGAGAITRWRRVILPLIAAPAVAAFMLCFMLGSADYVTPQFLAGPQDSMIGVAVQNAFKALGDYPLGAAMGVVVLISYAVLYALLSLALRLMRLNRVEWRS
jgi:spermidine/putrescine transport system permease protein